MCPMFLAISLSRYFMCSVHKKFSYDKTPKFCSIDSSDIAITFLNADREDGILRFLHDL